MVDFDQDGIDYIVAGLKRTLADVAAIDENASTLDVDRAVDMVCEINGFCILAHANLAWSLTEPQCALLKKADRSSDWNNLRIDLEYHGPVEDEDAYHDELKRNFLRGLPELARQTLHELRDWQPRTQVGGG
jgi:hypothetical protein